MAERIRDVFLSLLFLSVFWPFYLLVALAIVCTSPGTPVYRARRVGKNAAVFTLFKFRSMRLSSGKIKLTTLKNDDRIFPFGAFLRMTKIDETPQIFNILRGEMSIVGFRPEDEVNAELIFQGDYRAILDIKPGLTSPASLFDYTHGEEFEDEEEYRRDFLPIKMELELYYAQNRTFWYDVRLIFRTIKIIFLKVLGVKRFAYPPEYEAAMAQLEQRKQTSTT